MSHARVKFVKNASNYKSKDQPRLSYGIYSKIEFYFILFKLCFFGIARFSKIYSKISLTTVHTPAYSGHVFQELYV